jgi:hypothetical protein
MGRPIKKSYFGNLSPGGVGGEGILTITPTTTGTDYTSTVVLTVGAPDIIGGNRATAVATVGSGGIISAVSVTYRGSGYLSAPAVTPSPATTGVAAVFTVALASTITNAIAATAFIPVAQGGVSGKTADIKKQESSRRYLVATADGVGDCKLVTTATIVAGEMYIKALDAVDGDYFVSKLTAHRATLVSNGTTGTVFVSGHAQKWSLTTANATTAKISSN